MNIPADLLYTKDHEWVCFTSGDTVKVGITDFAQSALGDIVFINLPDVGDEAVAGESFADVESVKAVSDIYCPVSGTITDVNTEVLSNPALINDDPYDAWLIEIGSVDDDRGSLLTAEEYEAQLAEEG